MNRAADWHDRMVALAREHVRVEMAGDIEATLATMEPDCVYEMQPSGRVFRGLDNARIAYEALTTHFQPRSLGGKPRQEWITDTALGQEYWVEWRGLDGATRRTSVLGILVFGDELLAGERIYGSAEFFREAYGRAFDEAEVWRG